MKRQKDKKELLFEKMREDLKAGRPSPDFIETFRIANLADLGAETRTEIQDYLQSITERILGPEYDESKHTFRFEITGEEAMNASIFREGKPPIILISKGLFTRFETEDQLASVLAHELTHFNLGNSVNSKLEEAASDAWSVMALHRAGYNPKALLQVLDLLSNGEDEVDVHGDYHNPIVYLDPHPQKKMRKRIIENALFVLAKDQGVADFDCPDTVPDTFKELQFSAMNWCVHTSHVSAQLSQAQYDQMSVSEKLSFWHSAIPGVFGECPEFYKNRVQDVCGALKELPVITFSPMHSKELDQLIDRILYLPSDELYRVQTALYEGLAHVAGYRDRRDPLPQLGGRLRLLKHKLSDFIYDSRHDATLEGLQTRAAEIKDLTDNFTFPFSGLTHKMQWPLFPLPSQDTIHAKWRRIDQDDAEENKEAMPLSKASQDFLDRLRAKLKAKNNPPAPKTEEPRPLGILPSWSHLIPYALQDETNIIAKLLLTLGAKDPRIIRKCQNDRPPLVGWYNNYEDYDALVMNEEGRIVGRTDSFRVSTKGDPKKRLDQEKLDNIRAYETRRLNRHMRAAQAAIDSGYIDWSILRQKDGFQKFALAHTDYIAPQITFAEHEDPFATALVQHIDLLMQDNPERYGPDVAAFFTDAKYKEDMESYFERQSSVPPELTSILDMMTYREDSRRYHLDFPPRSGYGFMVGLGVSLDHPYARFVIEDKYHIFSQKQKIMFLEHVRYMEREDPTCFKNPSYRMTLDFRDIMGYKKPENCEDLERALDILEEHQYKNREEEGLICILHYHCKMEVTEFFEAFDGRVPLPLLERCSKFRDLFGDGPFGVRLERAFGKQLEKNKKFDFQNLDLADLVEAYRVYENNDILGRCPRIKSEYNQEIRQRLRDLQNSEDILSITENLIFNTKLDDPKLKKDVIRRWVKTTAGIYGIDDHSPAYFSKISQLCQKVIDCTRAPEDTRSMDRTKNNAYIFSEILPALAEEVQAQEGLSFHIRDMMQDALKKSVFNGKNHLISAAGELGLDVLAKREDLRLPLIDFLTSPLTRENVGAFHDILAPLEHDMKHTRGHTTGRSIYFNFYSIFLGYMAHNSSEEQRHAALANMHENFWSLPIEARTFYIEKVIFPTDQKHDQDFHRSADVILDKILPEGHKYADLGRLMINAYLENLPIYGQRVLLSALMVASDTANPGDADDESIGRALGEILVNLEPAGVKLAQSIHSHPDTPEGIRKGMDDVKGRSNLPLRWDLFTRMNDVLPAEKRKVIKHVGSMLGGGAYQYTVGTLMQDDRETAMSFLRRNIRPRAEAEFSFFENAAETLIAEKPEFSPLRDIIAQAFRSSYTETDYDLGQEQVTIAEDIYNGLSICINGEDFTFSTASWLDHGEDWKECAKAPGVCFNDLPADTDAQQKRKVKLAKAILAAEFITIISGRTFDHDSHGSNLNIKNNHITRYDHGAMSLTPPSVEEKKLLGKAIGQAVRASALNKHASLGSLLFNSLSDIQNETDNAKQIEYLATVQRGILALGDYIKVLDTQDVIGILTAVTKHPNASEDILNTTRKEIGIGAFALLASKFATTKGKQDSIRISPPSQNRTAPSKYSPPSVK